MKNRTLGSVFIVAGTTLAQVCWQCRWLRQVLVLASLNLVDWALGVDVLHGAITAGVYQHVPADTGLGTLAKRYLGATVSG